MAKPEFKKDFTYANIGNVVGNMAYAKELKRKDGSVFGYDFLVNVKGYGGINVKVPMMNKAQETMEKFPVAKKAKVRFNLVAVDAYFAQSGKTYLSMSTFNVGEEPKEGMTDRAVGRLAGEVAQMKVDAQGNITFLLVVYQTDKEGKLVVSRKTGKPFEPKVIPVTVTDDELKQQLKEENVRDGANISVGYAFTNLTDSSYDEFGFSTGTGKRVTRITMKKMLVHSVPEPEPEDELPEDEFQDPFAEAGQEIDPFADAFNDFPF